MVLLKKIKSLVPPFIWDSAKYFKYRQKFEPKWNTLSFPPFQDIKIFFDPKGPWQKKIMNGSYDSFLWEKINNLKPQGKIIYDIGAHIGFHSLCFSKLVGKNGLVASFEPSKVNFERLVMNVKENTEVSKIIKTFNIAVSNDSGEVKFTTNNDIENGRSTGGFLDNSDTYWDKTVFKSKGFSDVIVSTIPIDDMLKKLNLPEPDIMKIDVEGAEYQVLLGAQKVIKNKKPVIFVEVHSIASMFDVTKLLNELSYKTELINKENNGVCYIEAKPFK